MRIYVAADFARADEANQVAAECAAAGCVVISTWHHSASPAEVAASAQVGGPPPETARAAAGRNLRELEAADVVVVLTTGAPARGGRHFETGFAVARGKPVVLVGPREHAFHHLDGVTQVGRDELPAVVAGLGAGERRSAERAASSALAATCMTEQGFELADHPTLQVDERLHGLWPRLLEEEVGELTAALEKRDLVEVADALADILYLAYSAAAGYGIPIDDVFEEIHRSNLTKVSGGIVEQRADGKVLKPPGFSPPDVASILRDAGGAV